MKVRTWFVIAVVFAIPISVAGQTPAARPTCPRSFDARDFGAVCDGKSLDTEAIQRAIDACVQQGGGIVVVDHGDYLTGTIQLRSHVELHLTSTATLLGVGDLAKYRRDPKEVYKLLDRSLVYAEGCDQIAITGQGTINGQEKQFKSGDRDLRPVLIRLRDCRNVRLEGVLVKSAASFAVHPIHFYVHLADRITLDNVRFQLEAKDLRPAIVCDDVEDFDVAGLKADGNPRAESLLRMQNAREVYVRGSRVLNWSYGLSSLNA
jgi:polygalacturonase